MSPEHAPKPGPPPDLPKLDRNSVNRIGVLVSRAATDLRDIQTIENVLTERFGDAVRPYRRTNRWPYYVQVMRRDETARLVLTHGRYSTPTRTRDRFAAVMSKAALERHEPITVHTGTVLAQLHHGEHSEGRVELALAHEPALQKDRELMIATLDEETATTNHWMRLRMRLPIADIMDVDAAEEIGQDMTPFRLTLGALSVIVRQPRPTR